MRRGNFNGFEESGELMSDDTSSHMETVLGCSGGEHRRVGQAVDSDSESTTVLSVVESGMSKAVRELVSEVESIVLLPAGAKRTAACSQPRRHLFDALVVLQMAKVSPKCLADEIEAVDSDSDSTTAPSTSSSHSEAIEFDTALADCEALQACVESLKACHCECDHGHFASTDYLGKLLLGNIGQ